MCSITYRIEIHETGVDTSVTFYSKKSTVTFFPGLTWFEWKLILVFDGDIHIVLHPKTVSDLISGKITRGCGLSSAALHSFMNCV